MRVAKRQKARPGISAIALGLEFYWEDDQPIPTEFRIFKFGENPSEKGTFVFDADSAASVMAEYQRHGKPMLIDYNHGTTLEAATPEQAIAAGEFIPQIRGDAQGNPELWATDIKWTDRAKAHLQSREYRLFSPFFMHDAKTGRVLRLINVALTNIPALDGIAPLMAASLTATTEGNDIMEEELKALKAQVAELSAKLSAKDEENASLRAKLSAFEEKSEEKDKTAASALSLRGQVYAITGKAKDDEAIGVLTALKASHERNAALESENKALKSEKLSAAFGSVLDKAVTDGKVTPAGRAFWENCAKEDGFEKATARLSAFCEQAPKVVPDKVDRPEERKTFTADQSRLMRATGTTPEMRQKYDG